MTKVPHSIPNRAQEPQIKTIWEYVEDQQALELLGRAIQIILGDAHAEMDEVTIDKLKRQELNKRASAESKIQHNPINENKPGTA
jgi:hypothetical protein